jgi:hypothetical protein
MKSIDTGLLRDIVKDQASIGSHYIPVNELLSRLGLGELLADARSRVQDALRQIEGESDIDWAIVQLDLADGQLTKLLGREQRRDLR